MNKVSKRELVHIADRYGMPIPDDNLDSVCAQVNALIEGSDIVLNRIQESQNPVGSRSWAAGTDKFNSVITNCTISTDAEDGFLRGMEIGVKDLIAVANIPMTCGSEVLRGHVPQRDATVVSRLLAEGATITCKTNLDEFAIGGPWGLTSAFRDGPIKNPHDTTRTAGGSSGGSAAAVAGGLVDAALGTDTGGSIRVPAALCGVVGIKPTYGIVPLTGVVETAYTQDHVGTLARTVRDAAAVLEAIVGKDQHDPGSLQTAASDRYDVGEYLIALEEGIDIQDLSLGMLSDGFGDTVDDEVADTIRRVIDQLNDQGASVTTVELELFDYAKPAKNIVSYTEQATHWRAGGAPFRKRQEVSESELLSYHQRTAASGALVHDNVKSKILAGAVLIEQGGGRYYNGAQIVRNAILREIEEKCKNIDALVCPTMPKIAPKLSDIIGDYSSAMDEDSKIEFDFGRNVRFANVTGVPAVTIPIDTVDSMPVGLQLVGERFSDARLLKIAEKIEQKFG